MIAKRIKFPLIASLRVMLPEGAEIQAVSIEDDISFLECAFPWDPESNEPPPPGAAFKEHQIETFLEGEKRLIMPEGETDESKAVEVEIEVPKPSDILRILGTIKTLETPATWHVFERLIAA